MLVIEGLCLFYRQENVLLQTFYYVEKSRSIWNHFEEIFYTQKILNKVYS